MARRQPRATSNLRPRYGEQRTCHSSAKTVANDPYQAFHLAPQWTFVARVTCLRAKEREIREVEICDRCHSLKQKSAASYSVGLVGVQGLCLRPTSYRFFRRKSALQTVNDVSHDEHRNTSSLCRRRNLR